MTLIVYKSGILAADSRATHECSSKPDGSVCSECGKQSYDVLDGEQKIYTPKGAVFRGQPVAAIAISGNLTLARRLANIVANGREVEEVYGNYLEVYGKGDGGRSASLLLVMKDVIVVVRAPREGDLIVEQFKPTEMVALGSGTQAAKWINAMAGGTAPSIINLAMAKCDDVGGTIFQIDFTKEDPVVEQFPGQIDPNNLLETMREAFQTGLRTEHEKRSGPAKVQKNTPRKPRQPKQETGEVKPRGKPGRKPKAKPTTETPPSGDLLSDAGGAPAVVTH